MSAPSDRAGDGHRTAAEEDCPRPGCTPPPGGWCGLCPAIRRMEAAAEQRGRDEVRPCVGEKYPCWTALRALADEATP